MKNRNHGILDEEEEYYSLVKNVFKILAPVYDTATMPISRTRDKVVDFTSARNGSRILDIGTGTGKQAFAFAKKGYDVTGIDLSEAMLKVANKKNKYENVEFITADASNLPFKDSSFDVSSASFALHDMLLTIREKALLRKSGIEITEELPVLLGAGRILKGIRMADVRSYDKHRRRLGSFIRKCLPLLLQGYIFFQK